MCITVCEQRRTEFSVGTGLYLRSVQRYLTELDQTSLDTKPQNFKEQLFQVRLVVFGEAADGAVVGRLIGRDDFVCHIGLAESFDASAGSFASTISVHQQADHHRRIKSRIANAVRTIPFTERLEVDLLNHVENKPRQMAFRQPVG